MKQIIRFYFLYEILKESIFFKKIWVKFYLTTNPKLAQNRPRNAPRALHISTFSTHRALHIS